MGWFLDAKNDGVRSLFSRKGFQWALAYCRLKRVLSGLQKRKETGVQWEWAFDVPLLACFQVTGPVGEGDAPDGPRRSSRIASLGEYQEAR